MYLELTRIQKYDKCTHWFFHNGSKKLNNRIWHTAPWRRQILRVPLIKETPRSRWRLNVSSLSTSTSHWQSRCVWESTVVTAVRLKLLLLFKTAPLTLENEFSKEIYWTSLRRKVRLRAKVCTRLTHHVTSNQRPAFENVHLGKPFQTFLALNQKTLNRMWSRSGRNL